MARPLASRPDTTPGRIIEMPPTKAPGELELCIVDTVHPVAVVASQQADYTGGTIARIARDMRTRSNHFEVGADGVTRIVVRMDGVHIFGAREVWTPAANVAWGIPL